MSRYDSSSFSQSVTRPALWAIVALIAMVTASPIAAQSVANGNIRGRVSDSSGATLPGVTVTATSPALIVPQLVTTTGADGGYTLPDLPIGAYTVTYELAGFQRLVRQEIRLTAGFTAEVNVSLGVGSISETLTVVGSSPVVDTTSTTPSVNLSGNYLTEVLPSTRRLQDVLAITPGMSTRFPSDLAGGTSGGGAYRNYGIIGQSTMLLDGVNTRQDSTHDQGAGNSPDMGTLEEMQVITVGGGAEQALPGAFVNMIVKSGGNTFSGRYEATGVHKKFQGNNISKTPPEQGLTVGDTFNYSAEFAGDLGGRLIKDKLWFYGAYRYRDVERTATGFAKAPGPDGNWLTDADNTPAVLAAIDSNRTLKLTYQLSEKIKAIGFYAIHLEDFDPYPPGGTPRLTPYPGSVTFAWDPMQLKGELQGTLSNNVLFNVMVSRNFAPFWTLAQEGYTGPRTFDNFTGLSLGPALTQLEGDRQSWGPSGSMSFFPQGEFLGKHAIKAGGALMMQYARNQNPNNPNGNYLLIYNRGVPIQLQTYDYPVNPVNSLNESGLFVQDTWRLGERTTFNLGLRYDRFHTFAPEQTKEQGQFGTAGLFPKFDVLTWNEMAPRVGVAYDVTGSGKTVLKAMWGRYNHSPGEQFAGFHNRNAATLITYRWTDPNGSGNYEPGEVNLSTSGADFITATGAANNLTNPDLKDARSYEAVFSVDRELMSNFGARVSYIYLRQSQLYSSINVLRPYSAWDVVNPRLDPGVDGIAGTADDGGMVNVYDYSAPYRGGAFVGNQRVNRPGDRDPKLNTIEAVFTRRQTGRWGLLASVSASKNDSYLDAIVTNPNQLYFDKDTTWDWETKFSGSYELPYQLTVSGVYQILNGIKGQRTFVFTGLPSSNTLTVRLEPFGTRQGPVRDMLNLRFGRTFNVADKGRLRANLEVLNALNAAAPWTLTTASGPNFMRWGTIDSPRLLRGTVSFTF